MVIKMRTAAGKLTRGLLLSAVALLSGCHARTAEVEREPVPVAVVAVHGGTAQSYRTYAGTVEEASSTPVSFGIGGEVAAIHVKNGQQVRAGHLLATIDSRDAANACDVAAATLQQACDAYNRAKQVYEKGSLPEIKWVEVQTRYNQAVSTYELAKRRLDDCSLRAPVDGTVERMLTQVGTHIAPGMPLLHIVDLSTLYIRISVPDVDVNRINVGARVLVDVNALPDSVGSSLPGVVAERDVTADLVAHSYAFRIRLQRKPQGLLPGMMCNCRLIASEGASVITSGGAPFAELPARAVQLANDGSRYVWLVRHGKAFRQPVKVADLTRRGVLIREGLHENDTVIVDGMLKVSEGMEVSPQIKRY